MLAQILFDQGKVADGLKILDGMPTSGPLGPAVLAVRGAGYEQDKKFDEAAKAYLDAASRAEVESEKNAYKADAARAYTAGGKKADAERLWNELLASGDPFYTDEASLRLGELKAQPATKG
jgi:predicted negative regulator of RcsB-dependent stress response